MAARASPYQGLVPYTEEDAPYFFGREPETRLITANLFSAQLTLLYGASGVGKSSVLRAGVLYQARARPDLLMVALNNWQGDPVQSLKSRIVETVSHLQDARTVPPPAGASLREYLASCAKSLNRRVILILDQFEEYFLYHPQDDTFASQLAEAVTESDREASFLISIREDGLGMLDRFEGRIPFLFDNYLRVEHLDRDSAETAITGPIAKYAEDGNARVTIEPVLVTEVLKQIRRGRVTVGEQGRGAVAASDEEDESSLFRIETPYLQLVMERLWDTELEAKSPILRLETLNRLGGAERIVRTHLDEVMNALKPQDRDAAASVLHYLVTPSGTKIAHTVSDLAQYCGLPESEISPVLEKLSSAARILRPVAPPPGQGGGVRYEIFHDVLAPAVLDWRSRYMKEKEIAEAGRLAIEQEQEAARQRELEHSRQSAEWQRQRAELAVRSARRNRLVAGGVLVVAVFALFQWRRAGTLANVAASYELAALASSPLLEDPLRLHLATRAYRSAPTTEALDALQGAVQDARLQVTVAAHSEVYGVITGPDGRIVTGGKNGTVAMWDAVKGDSQFAFSTGGGFVVPLRFAHDGSTLIGLTAEERTDEIRVIVHDLQSRATHEFTLGGLEDVGEPELVFIDGQLAFPRFSPDGSQLVIVVDGKAAVWNVFGGERRWNLRHDSVVAADYSRGGTRIATLSEDGTVKVWNATSGRLFSRFKSPGALSVALSPNGAKIITFGEDALTIWDVDKRVPIFRDSLRTEASSIAFGPSGDDLAVAAGDSVVVYSLIEPYRRRFEIPQERNENGPGVLFSPDGLLATTGGDRGVVQLWGMNGARFATFSGHKKSLFGMLFSADGSQLITGSEDGTARAWTVYSQRKFQQGSELSDIAFGWSGQRLATANDGVAIWDTKSGRLLTHVPDLFGVIGIDLSQTQDSVRIALVRRYRYDVVVYDGESGEEVTHVDYYSAGYLHPAVATAFSPDQRRLAGAWADGTVIIRDITTGDSVVLKADSGLNVIAFSPHGQRIATAGGRGTARIWTVATGDSVLRLRLDSNAAITDVAFSPDDRFLVTADDDGLAVVWDLQTRTPHLTLTGHTQAITSMAISRDGRHLATGSEDETARVWSLSTGTQEFQFSGRSAAIKAVAFTPEGKVLATGAADGTVRMFFLDPAELLRVADSTVTRPLTDEECRTYLHMRRCDSQTTRSTKP